MPPLLETDSLLDFGKLSANGKSVQAATVTLTIFNSGSEYLQGQAASRYPWLRIEPTNFSCRPGERCELGLSMVGVPPFLDPDVGYLWNDALMLSSNAGVQPVAVHYGPPELRRGWAVAPCLIVGAVLCFLFNLAGVFVKNAQIIVAKELAYNVRVTDLDRGLVGALTSSVDLSQLILWTSTFIVLVCWIIQKSLLLQFHKEPVQESYHTASLPANFRRIFLSRDVRRLALISVCMITLLTGAVLRLAAAFQLNQFIDFQKVITGYEFSRFADISWIFSAVFVLALVFIVELHFSARQRVKGSG